LTASKIVEIDKCLASWRQGDVVRGDEPLQFIHLANLRSPNTPEAEELAAGQTPDSDGLDMVSVDVLGLVVLTQTYDLVRSCRDRPYVEVCPLVEILDNQAAALVRLGRRPRFAALPALSNGNNNLVADLDRVMTIEKGALALMVERRERGVGTESEARIFAEFLGLKRTRPALPNEFATAVNRMRNRIVNKHSVKSPEGEFLRAVREIRVRGIPDWDAEVIEVEFIFVFDQRKNIPKDAEEWIGQLISSVETNDRIAAVGGRSVGLDQLSAAAYLESCRLDLDHLSWGT
jgi:hypothetical protein